MATKSLEKILGNFFIASLKSLPFSGIVHQRNYYPAEIFIVCLAAQYLQRSGDGQAGGKHHRQVFGEHYFVRAGNKAEAGQKRGRTGLFVFSSTSVGI